MTNLTPYITEILLLLFVVIVFLQSGLDKLLDWKGNLSWLKEHFFNTPFKNNVPFLLGTVMIMELLAGIISLAGIIQILYNGNTFFGLIGAVLAAVSLLMLLFGQRMAKDYDGAKTIAIYFVPVILLVFFLQF